MKRPVVFTVFIFIGILAAALALLALRFLDPLYTAAAIPLAAGALIILAGVFIAGRGDRKFYRLLKATGGGGEPVYDEISRCLDSIDASILKLRESSEAMKINAGELNELSRWFGGEAGPPEREPDGTTETRTQGESVTIDVRLIHPADGPVPPGPFPLPESHQKIWFFPRK
jgi:hypothetical protein